MNNYITLYGEPLEYPHQVSVDKRGVAYYGFNMATERVSGIKDITQVIVEEGTPAFESLTAIDQVKDLLDCKLLVTGRIRTRNIKRKDTDGSRTKEKEHSKLYISVRAQEITDQEYEGDTNGVVLTGFVCKKGDMRTTPRGIRITDMILACWREDDESNVSDYIPAITWNGTAARAADNLNVGDCIEVRGRLQSREYTKELEHGETEVRTCYELSIEEYQVAAPAELKKEA
ncbi:single-stranded DNA-binding protein [Mediterraneibacter gnavus]|uniref:single-stranded DNA-binding protein n=1 Tax=Mediterraneibacter gnavus TaxID=33038 RepID=UPI0015E06F52|nr:single-stranded DNA-binding protein [Mediterraneibacter gnavus]